MADVPDQIADRLYAEPPERFVVAREQAATRAREAGQAATARGILKLRRPTIAAWLVNLLAIRRPDLISELTGLAAAMRAAQRELRGADLRELSAERRTLVASLVGQARALATEADPRVDPQRLPLGEVETTLNAALSDAEVAAAVTSGRLLRAVAYAGFGEIPRPQLRLLTGGAAAAPRTRQEPAGQQSAPRRPRTDTSEEGPGEGSAGAPSEEAGPEAAVDVRALRRELTSARTGQKRAESDLERATAAEHDGARRVADLGARLAELERQRSAAEQELSRLKLARKAAERAAVAARRRLGEAQAAVEHADTEVPERAARSGRADRKGLRQAQSGG